MKRFYTDHLNGTPCVVDRLLKRIAPFAHVKDAITGCAWLTAGKSKPEKWVWFNMDGKAVVS